MVSDRPSVHPSQGLVLRKSCSRSCFSFYPIFMKFSEYCHHNHLVNIYKYYVGVIIGPLYQSYASLTLDNLHCVCFVDF